MKKFLGVIVAVALCACLLVPTAFAADETDSIVEALQNADSLSSDEVAAILDGFDLEGLDIDAIIAEFEGEDENEALEALNDVADQLNSVQAVNSGDGTGASGFDIAAILELIPVDFDTAPIAEMLGSLTDGGLESLIASIGSIFGGEGISLASLDFGSFDIANLSAGGDLASGATNLTAGLADTLVGALETLGLDSTAIEGLLDNEIVNFFANMYIGFIGEVEDTTVEETTTKPAVVTTTTPKTGDTSAVLVSLATLTVAAGAAFVCLKKKKIEA